MNLSLLHTKLHAPEPVLDTVPRARLLERLGTGNSPVGVTLLSAPAGFGKTTLLAHWISQQSIPIAWLSLDQGDNGSRRFWLHLMRSLEQIEPSLHDDLATNLHVINDAPMQEWITHLLNRLNENGRPGALILDDFHCLENAHLLQEVKFFFEHIPSHIRLVISTRADPLLPLGRMRSQGLLHEIRTDDFRFSLDECVAYLNHFKGLDLPVEDIELLVERTEGWITALQLLGLSLKGRDDKSEYIRRLAGSNRYIADYLIEEVLDKQTPQVRQFLLVTSILDQIEIELSRALCPDCNVQAIVEELERNNIFINRLDPQEGTFRYHQLFAELLRNRLDREYPGRVGELHRQAADWFMAQDRIGDAMSHALQAGENDFALDLLEHNVMAVVSGHGQLRAIGQWIDTMPISLVESRPWVSIGKAWTQVWRGKLAEVSRWLESAQGNLPFEPEARKHVQGHIDLIRANLHFNLGERPEAVTSAQKALDALPYRDVVGRIYAASTLSACYRANGDLERSVKFASDTLHTLEQGMAPAGGDLACLDLWLSLYGDVAGTLLLQGKFEKLKQVCQRGLTLADTFNETNARYLPALSLIYARLSNAQLEQYNLEDALRLAQDAVARADRAMHPILGYIAYAQLAEVYMELGQFDQALSTSAISREKISSMDHYHPYTDDQVATILARAGDLEGAQNQLSTKHIDPGSSPELGDYLKYLTAARVAQSCSHIGNGYLLERGLAFLETLIPAVRQSGHTLYLVEGLVLQTTLQLMLEGESGVRKTLSEALQRASISSHRRPFIAYGVRIERLLGEFVSGGAADDFGREILRILRKTMSGRQAGLTDREIQVLRLLASGMTSTQVADELVIAVSTARTHIKNIYRKLNVHQREQAIDKARQILLL